MINEVVVFSFKFSFLKLIIRIVSINSIIKIKCWKNKIDFLCEMEVEDDTVIKWIKWLNQWIFWHRKWLKRKCCEWNLCLSPFAFFSAFAHALIDWTHQQQHLFFDWKYDAYGHRLDLVACFFFGSLPLSLYVVLCLFTFHFISA